MADRQSAILALSAAAAAGALLWRQQKKQRRSSERGAKKQRGVPSPESMLETHVVTEAQWRHFDEHGWVKLGRVVRSCPCPSCCCTPTPNRRSGLVSSRAEARRKDTYVLAPPLAASYWRRASLSDSVSRAAVIRWKVSADFGLPLTSGW